jgi:hypothetical protein
MADRNTWRGNPLTHGPWAWSGDQLLTIRDGHSETVLAVHDEIWAPNDADKALISAAPDLLETLQTIMNVECPRGLNGGDIVATRALEEIHDLALAAISKAQAGSCAMKGG